MLKEKKILDILLIQTVVFYCFPLLFIKTNPFIMILVIIIFTFFLSIITGIIINNKIKFLLPLIISIIYIPSVYIYYNESALIYTIWYLGITYIGLLIGMSIKKL